MFFIITVDTVLSKSINDFYVFPFHAYFRSDHVSRVTQFIPSFQRHILKVYSGGSAMPDPPSLQSPTQGTLKASYILQSACYSTASFVNPLSSDI